MNHLRTYRLVCCMLLLSSIMVTKASLLFRDNQREKYNFNSRWCFHVGDKSNAQTVSFDDRSWRKITLPYAFNEDEAFKVAIDQLMDTVVWYRKHFKLPKSSKGRKIFLEFEGIRFGGEFFLNGKSIGVHENGVMACGFDITDFVNFGAKENILAIRIDNSWKYKEKATGSTYEWNDKNFNANYGGIPKNVYLHILPKLYQTLPLYSNLKTTGTYIYAKEINISKKSADIYAESEVRNETPKVGHVRFVIQVEDIDGKLVKQFQGSEIEIAPGETRVISANDTLTDLHFWSWGYGYLYHVYTILYVDGKPIDVVNTRTGFRKTAFRNGMVYLNDRVIQLKGYAQRTSNEWPAVGMSVPAWLSDFSNGMMVDGNANFVRWMHVTPWKQDVESCDRVGLIEAMPAGDAEKDVTDQRWGQRVELMRDAIIYNRNNPSILFYESGNKGISEEHMTEMKSIRDKYDPYGGRAIGAREMLDSKVAEYGGEMLYINKSTDKPVWSMEYCRDEALRKYWDEQSYPYHKDGDGPLHKGENASVYNRNQDSFVKELVYRWFDYFRVRPGTGRRVNSGGAKIVFSDTNTHFRGAENYRRSGVVDAVRIPKDAYFAQKVMWNGWVDTEKQETYIVGHWNYTPGTIKNEYVVSTADKIELLINGKSQGFGKRDSHFLFTFPDVHWAYGRLEAIGYDQNHRELSRSKIETAGTPVSIKLTLQQAPDGLKADGADLVLVQVEVVDSLGRRCPLANNLIHFNLKGPAEWRGGIAQGVDNYILSKNLPVECGVNRVLIRSTTHPGQIYLTASSDGLKIAEISFSSRSITEKDGLSTYISGDVQPSHLNNGETPSTPSFIVSRKPVGIVGATTATNQDKVGLSFDDNEQTEWTNDGKLETGWISYELDRDAVVSQIEMKLTGWRMRSYPIQIFVDDQKVFEGNTEKSLGYIVIPIKPTKGRFVKIKLFGQSSDKDAFNSIVEVTGTKELDLYKDTKTVNAKGLLRIDEIEIYE